MNDFQTIKKFLIDKVNQEYTKDKVTSFRNSLPDLNPTSLTPTGSLSDYKLPEGNFGYDMFIRCVYNKHTEPFPIWEKLDSDFYFYKPTTSVYYTADGYVCRLSQRIINNNHDWDMFNQTYTLNKSLALINMEEPILGEIVQSNYIPYMYSVVKRPGLHELIDPYTLHSNRELSDTSFKNGIDLIANQIELMKNLYDSNPIGLPDEGSTFDHFRMNPTWKATGVDGMFVDFKRYTLTFTQYLQKSYSQILDYCQSIAWYDEATKQSILEYALNLFSTRFGVERQVITNNG